MLNTFDTDVYIINENSQDNDNDTNLNYSDDNAQMMQTDERSRSRSRSRSPISSHRSDKRRGGGGNDTNQYRSQHQRRSGMSDKDLGLKYKWEHTVYVKNIAFDVKWTELKDLFRRVGDIQYCEIFERNGKSYGCGAVEFKQDGDAEKAVDEFNGYEISGRKINVQLDPDGSQTRRVKEICRNSSKTNERSSGVTTTQTSTSSRTNTANIAASSNSNALLLAALGNFGAPASHTTNTLLSSLINPSASNAQTGMLNQLAKQLNIDGPVTNRIFVANLDFKINESKIREVFNLAGKVVNVSFFRDRDSGKSRGIALVEYDTGLEALNAISMFDGQVLNDRKMNVRFDTKPQNSDDGRGGGGAGGGQNLPSGLKSIGTGLGIGGLSGLGGLGGLGGMLQKPLDSSAPLVGADAFAALTSTLANTPAVPNFNSLSGLSGLSAPNFGNLNNFMGLTGGNVQSSRSSTGTSKLFIRNLPYSWDERRLKEKFRQAGAIEFAEIKIRDGKSRGFGVIKYYSPDDAEKAVQLFNGSRFDGRQLEVKLDEK